MIGSDAATVFELPEIFQGIEFIDSHHHLWQLDRFPYRWLAASAPPARFGDKASIRRNYLPADYLRDISGIPLGGSVHVQANCGAVDPAEETRWLQRLSDQSGWPSAAVAEVNLLDPSAPELIEKHAAYPILRGVRTPVAWDGAGRWRVASQPNVLSEKTFAKVAQKIAAFDLTLEMVVVPSQLIEVAEFATEHPDVKIVINHFGTLEETETKAAETWWGGIERLAPTRNVYVKLSGLWTVDKSWKADIIQPFATHVLDTLGASRVMWGSNLPVEGVNCSLPRQIQQLSIMFSSRPRDDLLQIFRHTAETVYRLGLDG